MPKVLAARMCSADTEARVENLRETLASKAAAAELKAAEEALAAEEVVALAESLEAELRGSAEVNSGMITHRAYIFTKSPLMGL